MGLYKGEDRRRQEDRRSGQDRRREGRGGEDRRNGQDRRRKRRRSTLFWILMILFVSFVLSALIGTINIVIEKYFNFKDDSYRPMDLDRMRYELEKAKSVDKK